MSLLVDPTLEIIVKDLLEIYYEAKKFTLEFYLAPEEIELEPSKVEKELTIIFHRFYYVSVELKKEELPLLLKVLTEEYQKEENLYYKIEDSITIGIPSLSKSLRVLWLEDSFGPVGLIHDWLILGGSPWKESPFIHLIKGVPWDIVESLLKISVFY